MYRVPFDNDTAGPARRASLKPGSTPKALSAYLDSSRAAWMSRTVNELLKAVPGGMLYCRSSLGVCPASINVTASSGGGGVVFLFLQAATVRTATRQTAIERFLMFGRLPTLTF
jgi:hypothetical protein